MLSTLGDTACPVFYENLLYAEFVTTASCGMVLVTGLNGKVYVLGDGDRENLTEPHKAPTPSFKPDTLTKHRG